MRQLALVTAFALLAAVLWWLWDLSTATRSVEEAELTRDEPDVYGRNVELTQFNPDGSLHYRLSADAIRQYNDDRLTRMTQPKIHLTSPDQPPWDVRSERGYIRQRPGPGGPLEDVVYLREQVRMVQNHPQNGLVTLRSEAFYVYPDRQYAETDQDVMIDTQVGRTKAGGLRADLQAGRLQLSSGAKLRVHTIVLPEQFKKG